MLNQMVKWGMTTQETADAAKAVQTFEADKVHRTAKGCFSSPTPSSVTT
ncbi:hypothetical protein G7085_14475 [Tessaracoccus sp. HDW20]|nr:hypothetical protein [Tessaracoccus coleopterorum]NHB85416.1 hypothetical protein [Tessaracoccus coleopterorum]